MARMHFAEYEDRLRGYRRRVETRGVRGQDAESLAAMLAERELLGERASMRLSVGNFRRAEARRQAVLEEAARVAGGKGRAHPEGSSPEERRAFAEAIRKARQALTDMEASRLAEVVLAGSTVTLSRQNALLLRRVGRLVLRSFRRRCDFDLGFLRDPGTARILLAGMRMWGRETRSGDQVPPRRV